MKRLKNLDGGIVRLYKTKIAEEDSRGWWATFEDIREAAESGELRIHSKARIFGDNNPTVVSTHVEFGEDSDYFSHVHGYRLGCHLFSRATFNKILKAAGVKPIKAVK